MNKIYKVVWSKVKNCYVVVSEIAKNIITGGVKSAKVGNAPMARGLALGAMMAFVITGNVWAEEQLATQTVSADKTFTDETFGPSEFTLGSEYTITHNGGKLVIDDCTFDSITKKSSDGNHDYGSVLNSTSGTTRNGVVISNTTITNNTNLNKNFSKKRDGILYVSGTDMTITNSEISSNNTTHKGGAIVFSTGTLTVSDSIFSKNRTSSDKGGAISVSAAAVNIDGGTKGNEFSSNTAASWGGAINSEGNSTINLTGKNTFSGNKVTNSGPNDMTEGGGGAIGLERPTNSQISAGTGTGDTLNIQGVAKFDSNSAYRGGAIFNSLYSDTNFEDATVTFTGNTAKKEGGALYNEGEVNFNNGVTVIFSGNTANGSANDIHNTGIVNINQGAVVNLDGGITGTGAVNINKGTLNGKVAGNTVTMTNGIWDLADKSEVSALSGNGTLKVDLTTGEQVKVLSANSAAGNASDDFSEIDIDHGGVVGVDVEQGVTNFYNTLVDSAGESLIKDRNIGDIFLQAAVETDGEGNFVSTTVKPGDKFIIDSENVKVNGNLEAESITVGGVVLEESLEGKADKADLDAEAKTRETKDNELLEKINQIDGGSSEAIKTINQRLDRTNAKINKVGAGAAALAALHPLDYDPDDKLTFSAGVGNYAGENAAALGAFYRPNEKFMVSLAGTMGNGENMVNFGLSIGLDKANGLAKLSKKELIQKVNAVEAENDALEDRVAKLEALVAQLANK